MCNITTSIYLNLKIEPLVHPLDKPFKNLSNPHRNSPIMWRNLGQRVSSRPFKTKVFSLNNKSNSLPSISTTFSFLGFEQDSIVNDNLKSRPKCFYSSVSNGAFPEKGFRNFTGNDEFLRRMNMHTLDHNVNPFGMCIKRYGSAAEAVEVANTDGDEVGVSHTDVDKNVSVGDEVQQLLKELRSQERRQSLHYRRRQFRISSGMSHNKYRALKRRQIKIETEAWEKAANEYNELLQDMCRHKLAPNLPYMKSMFLGWYEPLRNKIEEVQEKSKLGVAKYFSLLPADKMAVITMHKLTAMMMTGGKDHRHGNTRVVQAACSIGEAIEQEVRIHNILEQTKRKKSKAKDNIVLEEDKSCINGQDKEKLKNTVTDLMKKQKLRAVNQILKKQENSKPWGTKAKAKVGSYLIELLLQTAYIQLADENGDGPPDIRPAFVHTFENVATKDSKFVSKRYGIIQCDPQILKGLEKTARHMVIPYMPMLIPPVKWTGYDKGAHIFLPSYVMRTHGARQQRDVIKNAPRKQLEPVFEALDTLGSTKWRVNKRVLNIIDRIWAKGGGLGDLVDREDIPLPEEPDTDDEAKLKKWRWKVRSVKKENKERYSQRCDIELKLAVARKMKDEEGFYYPHNLDFRGRAYPLHPHLNHLGSDVCRGVLEFAEGRILGQSGLRWLKIHLANLYANGVDKLPSEGRITFTESHLDEIFDSADRPLEGERWWLKAEDPFQCLAVCINLAEALRSTSPETTVSRIPIHQDGSCNGLQHYAALGRDKLGAASVNLIAGDQPADVYTGISTRVLEIMQRDAQKDPEIFPEAMHARALINQVDRKLVKQTVMTSVYGVTYIGARDQIKKRLKERDAIEDDAELFGAACYAAKTTLMALGEMFEAARGIMTWLGECAKIIASENETVSWITPLGLPVVQPYRIIGRNLVKTSLQVLSLQRETDQVMVRRQRTAFPPNFVHSLDGTHMMMTALACKKEGLTFAGVHDSYWTHACDVDGLNRILREKFVELYETPVLEDLLEGFQKSFPSCCFPPLPERGDFDLKDVLSSPYFFN